MSAAAVRAPRQTESGFQRQVLRAAAALRWRAYHSWSSIHCVAGFPDLVLVRPPDVIFAELKTNAGTVTAAQEAWIDSLSRCPGVSAVVWRPRDWDQIVAVLRGPA